MGIQFAVRDAVPSSQKTSIPRAARATKPSVPATTKISYDTAKILCAVTETLLTQPDK